MRIEPVRTLPWRKVASHCVLAIAVVVGTTVSAFLVDEAFAGASAPQPSVTEVAPTTGPVAGATVVTITGTDFSGATGVAFGLIPAASFTVVSSTTVTATSPAQAAGTVDVTVTTSGGTSGTSAADQFTYDPVPSVTGLNPSAPSAVGTSVQITGTGFVSGSVVSFGGVAASSVSVVSSTQITATAPLGSGMVNVTVSTPGGTSPTSPSDEFTYLFDQVEGVGNNNDGQLGNGTTTSTTLEVTPAGLPSVSQVAAGEYFSLALTASGNVYAWGQNKYGQLGNGTTAGSNVPVEVDAGSEPGCATYLCHVVAIGAGANSSYAVTASGNVYAWGEDNYGQLGNGSTAGSNVPVEIDAGSEPGCATYLCHVASVAGDATGALALTTSGTVYAWGQNKYGQLGDNSVTESTTPVAVQAGTGPSCSGSLCGVSAVSAGDQYALALTTSGTVFAWGYNGEGQLGDNSIAEAKVPVEVQGLGGIGELTGATGIAAGYEDAYAVTVGGGVDAWGAVANDALGNPNVTANALTATAVPGLSGVETVYAGVDDAYTLNGFGQVWDWGDNGDGQLGIGPTDNIAVPIPENQFNDPGPIAAGWYHLLVPEWPNPFPTSMSPTSGPLTGGTVVTINDDPTLAVGTGFAGVTGVSFGSTPATNFTVVSSSRITATAPPGTGTGTVYVSVSSIGGNSGNNATFTYVSPPAVTGVSPGGAPAIGGTMVTISGTSFTGATAVDFGLNAASAFTVVSATEIIATAPPGSPGTVDVTVTTPGGGTSANSGADGFTYSSAPQPSVTEVAPTTGPVAGATVVTITGTDFSGATGVAFGLIPAASFTVVSSTTVTATSPAQAAGTVDVTVTTSGGTSGTSAADQFTYDPVPSVTGLNLSADGETMTDVALTWTPSLTGGVTGYQILRQGVVVKTTDSETTNYVDTGLTPNTSYTYNVQAIYGSTTSDPSAPLTVTTANSAQTIPITGCSETPLASGSYVLTADLSETSSTCIRFSSTSHVSLDCQNHTINSTAYEPQVYLSGVTDFLVVNCTFAESIPEEEGIQLEVDNSSNGAFANDSVSELTVAGGDANAVTYFGVNQTTGLAVSGDIFTNTFLSQTDSQFNYIGADSYTNPNQAFYESEILSSDSSYTTIDGNSLDGNGDPSGAELGVDDAIDLAGAGDPKALFSGGLPESNDVISGNTLKNVFDTGIETEGLITDTTFEDNTISGCPTAAIGSFWGDSWQGNTVLDNHATGCGYLFVFDEDGNPPTLDGQPAEYFENNTFEGNTIANPGAAPLSAYFDLNSSDYGGLPIITGNNVFIDNNFGGPNDTVIINPASMAIDGGGNVPNLP